MKRALAFVGPTLIVAVVLFVLLQSQPTVSNTLGIDERLLDTPLPTLTSDSEPERDTSATRTVVYPAAAPEARPARVERLADGDSFDIRWLDTDEADEIRLFGINAPESGACFGFVARGVLEVLTSEREILVEPIDRDDFGRVLANVWVDDIFVNARLVEQGAALALTDGSTHAQLIKDAQAHAQANKSGLWSPAFCGTVDQADLTIAEIFENAPGRDNVNPNGEWIDIANSSNTAADLTDWSIRDESTRHRFFFPNGFALAGHAHVRVFSGCGDDDATSLYWCDGGPVWNNSGDTAFLVDPDGRFVDTVGYQG
jgi:endonuclease YncB( thermonuclease family)